MWKQASTARNQVNGSLATYAGILHLSTGIMEAAAESSRRRREEGGDDEKKIGVTTYRARVELPNCVVTTRCKTTKINIFFQTRFIYKLLGTEYTSTVDLRC